MELKELQRQVCLVYSRVTGWFVPKSSMNLGKVAEFNDRQFYSNNKATK